MTGTRTALIALLFLGGSAFGQTATGAAGSAAQPANMPAAQPAAQPATQPEAQPAGQPAPVAPSGVQPEARERMEAATKALEEANSLSFKIATTLPKFQDAEARVDGSVEMMRRPDGTGWMIRREGTGTNLAPTPTPYLVTTDGTVVTWIDKDKQTVFERYTRAAKDRQVQAADQGWLRQLVEAPPFAKELAAPKATLEGTATVDGTPCDIVLINYGENKETRRWFFAAADHMPRRLEIAIGSFKTTYELTDLKVNPELAADRFTLATPEGFKREAIVKPATKVSPSDDTPPVITPRPRPTPGDADAPPALRAAPAFELKGLDGKAVTLESLKDNVVILGFWGAWHRGGKMAAPELQALADRYKGKAVKVYWLSLKGKDEQGVEAFVKDNKLTFGVLTDADAVAKDFQVRSYPGFVVVGNDGMVLHQSGGFVANETMAEIQKVIDTYLENGGKMPEAQPITAPGTGNTPGGPSKRPATTPSATGGQPKPEPK